MGSSVLISEEYRALNRALHKRLPAWGTSRVTHQYRPLIERLAKKYEVESMLDYGCGKAQLPVEAIRYDPAIEAYSELPSEPADMVLCLDVLEHVEPECVDAVIAHIHALTRSVALFSICLVPASNRLPDGSNAHRSVHDAPWWLEKLSCFDEVIEHQSKIKVLVCECAASGPDHAR